MTAYPPLDADRHERSETDLAQTLLYTQLIAEDGSLDYFVAEYDPETDIAFGWQHDGGNARGTWRDFELEPLLTDDDVDVDAWDSPDTQETVAREQHLNDDLNDDEY